jgi:glycosyltransferase involved in cell wall biosynthesis
MVPLHYDNGIPSNRIDGHRRSILVVISHYLPGYRAGGPVRSVEALVDRLGSQFEIRIICLDRDLGDSRPYEGIETGIWLQSGKAEIMYLSKKEISFTRLKKTIHAVNPDVLYLNTFFSVRFTLFPLLSARLVHKKPATVLAVRGSLSPGALGLKPIKKQLFLRICKASGIFRLVTWQATSEDEQKHIKTLFPRAHTVLAPNLSVLTSNRGRQQHMPEKRTGHLRVIFLSRISPKKNLAFAIDQLSRLSSSIEFTIAGPIEDEVYWQVCLRKIESLPGNIHVRFLGPVHHDDVDQILRSHHLYILPTLSENFGHSIIEAFGAGLVVLISDQTPWHYLERLNVGWDIPLNDGKAWERALQRCCDLDDVEFKGMSESSLRALSSFLDQTESERANSELFTGAIRVGSRRGSSIR